MALNNLVILKGNLTRDPDMNNSGEDMVTSFTLAVSKYSDSVDFIRCVAFNKTSRKLAEFIGSKARKGDFVHIMGSISTGSYINKEGQKVYTTDIIVDDFGFLESLAVKEARLTNAAQQFQEPMQQAQQVQPVQQAQQVQPVQQGKVKKPRPQFTMNFGANIGSSLPFQR